MKKILLPIALFLLVWFWTYSFASNDNNSVTLTVSKVENGTFTVVSGSGVTDLKLYTWSILSDNKSVKLSFSSWSIWEISAVKTNSWDLDLFIVTKTLKTNDKNWDIVKISKAFNIPKKDIEKIKNMSKEEKAEYLKNLEINTQNISITKKAEKN